MTSIQPAWLGVPVSIIVLVATALAVTAVVYALVPQARKFIKGDRPVWWVRDGFLAVFVAVLVLFGHSYVLSASEATEQSPDDGQAQDQRISDLGFVRDRSSEQYQVRPFRGFDLSDMNLAGLQLMGADLVGADLGGANLTGTSLRRQPVTPETPGPPGWPPIPRVPAVNTYMQGVNLCHADLTGADLRHSYLVNANLTGADLTSTRLQGAALNGSDLSGATMPADAKFLERIYYDDNTIWPEGFQPPPAETGHKLRFLQDPNNNELYGDIQRPTCNP